MAGRCPPALLLPLAALLATVPGAARAVPEEKQHPSDLIKRNFVYGNTKQEGQMYRNPTETGKLKVERFKESMSGAYTCTRSYKSIDPTTQEEREVLEAYRFRVYGKIGNLLGPHFNTKYTNADDEVLDKIRSAITAQNSHTTCFLQAYREADHAYQIFVHVTTKECELAANDRFFEELKKIVNNFISDLKCQITESSYKCRSVQTPTQLLQPRLFVSFQVNPFAPGWEEVCHQVPYNCEDATNTRVEEARNRIEEFFSEQTYALKHEFQTVPTIHYVDNSFSALQIDSCRPGFGKNNITHQSCAGCCVVCEPGTYSPNNDVTCQICGRPRVGKYGARSC